MPDAYAAAKVINGIVMSLAAIPAYLLARRLLPARLALFAAALAVLVPSMLYTGMLMTENAFYPLFLLRGLPARARARGADRRCASVGLLAVCAVAFETRAQAIALFAAAATAPRPARADRAARPRGDPASLRLALRSARGRRRWPRSASSSRSAARRSASSAPTARPPRPPTPRAASRTSSSTTSPNSTSTSASLPFAALLALWFAPRGPVAGARAFAAASLALSAWLLLEVSAFASASYVDRIEERNTFYLAPLALTALLGLAADGVITRRRRVLALAAALAGIAPFFIPYARFITTSAVSDTFALLPWWWVQDHYIHLEQVKWAALGVSLAAGALFFLLPRRFALLLPALVAAYFVATSFVVENGRHGLHETSVGSLYAGTHETHPDWIDRTVGRGASVAVLWTGTLPSPYPVYENEFFSRSVRHGLRRLPGSAPRPAPGGTGEAPAQRRARERRQADPTPSTSSPRAPSSSPASSSSATRSASTSTA